MSYYYPQGAVKLRILPEDFKLKSSVPLNYPFEIIVQAKKITINTNDYRTSDTFTLELDYKSFPFDPRTIRACAVIIYMEDMKKTDRIVPSDKNAIFTGYVDTDTIALDEGRQLVTFEGRDQTSLLIDQKYAVNKPVSEDKPVDDAIREFLAQVPVLERMKVINKTGDVLPSLSSFYPEHADALNGQKNPSKGESYWSMIQDAANRAGLVCFMSFNSIILTTPKNQADTKNDDIRFIYGKNVKKLEFKRKLGRLKGINVQVRSRSGKDVIIAKIPEEATQAWCDAFGIEKAAVVIPVLKPTGELDTVAASAKGTGTIKEVKTVDTKSAVGQVAPYLSFNYPNVGTHEQLVVIGQSIYEQYSLQQLEGSLETREMLVHSSAKKYNLPVDLKKGMTIAIEIDIDDLQKISRLATFAEREDYLIKKSYSRQVASIFATTLGKFSTRFQIKTFTQTLDCDTGWSLNITFQNILDTKQAGL